MSDKKIAVKADRVSKYSKLPTEATQSLRTNLVNHLKDIKGYHEQHVLKDIDFEVEEGDFFGIVGRSGSGKSILLKIISQIYIPGKGKVTVNGKMVSFIELDVGFNLELTGRENVYMNGATFGFTAEEVGTMYDDIVEFAELEDFMSQKFKNYSSGMQVRLAFSVAIKAQDDVFILDEVLAVGDEAFQRKCNNYSPERRTSGKTTILVTHDMGTVKKCCNEAILIEDGYIRAQGEPNEVANQYSYDNANTEENDDGRTVEKLVVDNLEVNLLSSGQTTSDKPTEFSISYNVLEDLETHVAFSLIDIDRNIWIYNDNSMEYLLDGKGHKHATYSCLLNSVNNLKSKLEVSIRDKNGEMLAFANLSNTNIILVGRNDLVLDDKSGRDSVTGLVQRNGTWKSK